MLHFSILGLVYRMGRGAFHECIARLKDYFGDLFAIQIGFQRIIVTSRINIVRHVLSDRNTYDISETTNRNFSLIFPQCLLAINGEAFQRHSRIMMPMYRKSKTLPYFDDIVHTVDAFIDEEFTNSTRPIHPDLVMNSQYLLLNIIVKIGFNYDLKREDSAADKMLNKAFNDVINCANHFAMTAVLPKRLARFRLKFDKGFQEALKTLKRFVVAIINEEKQRQEEHELDSSPRKSLIQSMVIAAEKDRLELGSRKASLTSDELFDEACLSMVAGFETTSTVLSWFFFLMSKYPEVQKRMKQELHDHDLFSHSVLLPEHCDNLTYMNCVIKEILRFIPVTPAVVRQATRDDKIEDLQIKKGDIFLLTTHNIHKNPNLWKIDPTKFIPERFLDADQNPAPFTYLPYGGGHRACIGQDLANFELRIIATRLMQRVTIEDPGTAANNSGGYCQRITCFPKHVALRVYLDENE